MVSMHLYSMAPKVTSMGGSFPANPPAVAVSHGSNSGKEKQQAFSSLFSPLGKMCYPCCSSFHLWSWCRWSHTLTLCMPSVMVPRCPASDKGVWQVVLLLQTRHKANPGHHPQAVLVFRQPLPVWSGNLGNVV